MSQDVVVSQKTIEIGKVPNRVVPSYLVTIERGKSVARFVAVKYDADGHSCAKMVGFYAEGSEDDIVAAYAELVKNTDVSHYKEVQIPWGRIVEIRNLIYKHKPQSK